MTKVTTMRISRIIVLFCFLGVSALMFYFLMRMEDTERRQRASVDAVELPYNWVGNINKTPIAEPSGITYHPLRKTLFVADDGGFIHEIRPDGTAIKMIGFNARDLEGITTHPITGRLYVVVEDEEVILEINPESLAIRREFKINRIFDGKPLLKEGGMGVEAIAFVPNQSHPEGGTFWIGNQTFNLKPSGERSVVCEVELPLKSSDDKVSECTIIRFFEMDFVDISGLTYDTQSDSLVLISDTTNLLVELKRDGSRLHKYLLPGKDQEGVTLDGLGYMYISQESGQIIKLADSRLR